MTVGELAEALRQCPNQRARVVLVEAGGDPMIIEVAMVRRRTIYRDLAGLLTTHHSADLIDAVELA